MTENEKFLLKFASAVLAGLSLAKHIEEVQKHKKTCRRCMSKDVVEIALDLYHLYNL